MVVRGRAQRYLAEGISKLGGTVSNAAILARQGVLRPLSPGTLARIGQAWRHWGFIPPLAYAVGAARHPERPAIIDERGTLSFAEVDQRTTRLANGLRARGLGRGSRVGVLCRNHRGPVETLVACYKIGADIVLLNTGLAAAQLADVLRQQDVDLLVADANFTDHIDAVGEQIDVVLGWSEDDARRTTLELLIAGAGATALPARPRQSRVVVLTSGTTGIPKGARRPEPRGLGPVASFLSGVPLRAGDRVLIAAPVFHTWGLAATQLGAVLGATLVLARRFEPREALTTVQRHRCTAMFAVPVMLQRLLEVPDEVRATTDHSSLRVVAVSGSALSADLGTQFQQAFGPVLYNFYGSTEVSWATIAGPEDLRAAPGTAGRAPHGTTLRILGDDGRPVPTGDTGQIFVGHELLFEGYTNAREPQRHGGLLATGDLGRVDESGRLFVVGRADDMIVSGGENVYPTATAEAIEALPGVAEAAVIGVPDEKFGQRLAAYVVTRSDSSLDAEAVRTRLKRDLPVFAVPRDVVFLSALPRNPTGKVINSELPDPPQQNS